MFSNDEEERRLVIMASGWTGVDAVWWNMSRSFSVLGYDTIRTVMPGRGFGSIEDSALSIGSALSEVKGHYDKIVFVGHSMGGLIGRVLIQLFEADFIDAYVSLGSPHQGSVLANLAKHWSRSAREMIPGSKFLTSLNSLDWPDTVPALVLSAEKDRVVANASFTPPNHELEISPGVYLFENKNVANTNHLTIPMSPLTYSYIFEWLTFNVFQDEVILIDEVGFSSKLNLNN